MSKRLRQTGFTIVELVVVITLISIVAVIAVVRSPGATPHLSAVTERLAGDIRSLQTLAQGRGRGFYMLFNGTGYVMRDETGTAVPGFDDTVLPSRFSLSSSGTLPQDLIAFDGRGIPYGDSALSTPLATDAEITLQVDGHSDTVKVLRNTGTVE